MVENSLADVRAGNACSGFAEAEIAELEAIAERYRAADTLLLRLVNMAGSATGSLLDRLPQNWQARLTEASDMALRAAYSAADASQPGRRLTGPLDHALALAKGERWHRLAAAASGALGGAGGLATTLVDLPVTTTLILRSIQQIAADYDEDMEDPGVRAQCIAVFALGGPLPEDDAAETSLWALRLALTGRTVAAMVAQVAPRFGVVLGQKALAQATPLLGAIAGGAVNPIFTGYYQAMAHVHFRLRRIERRHEPERVRACFERLVRAQRGEADAQRAAHSDPALPPRKRQ